MAASRDQMVAFIADAIASSSSDCIEWPFGRISSGYGSMNIDGRSTLVHRHVLVLAHGPAPEARPLALHDPECISRACVNPRHLRWGTNAENMNDKRASGTALTGESHPRSVLTDQQVDSIRSLYRSGTWTQQALAERFATTQPHISRLVRQVQRSEEGAQQCA